MNNLPENILSLAKELGVSVRRETVYCSKNHGSSAGEDIYLGEFDDPNIELVAFFHEVGHVKSKDFLHNRTHYMSHMSKEGLAWELGLTIASEKGFTWDYDSKEMKWAREQMASYVNGEYDDMKVYYKCH